MDQSVDGRDGHRLFRENVAALLERLVAGDDQRTPFIRLRDEFEQDAGLALILRGIPEIIQDHAVEAVQLGQKLRKAISAGSLELLDRSISSRRRRSGPLHPSGR